MHANGNFYAMLFRMKDINRWGLMYNTKHETLAEHSMQCALLAHALAQIGIHKFGKNYSADRICTAALLHDMSEILTGDLPTPVKYHNDEIRTAYKKIEAAAEERLLSSLDEEMRDDYRALVNLPDEEKAIVKAADKLCAYIKCLQEEARGNPEFASAKKTLAHSLDECALEELKYFRKHYLDAFSKNLDEMSL
ncbi:MAG: 5'-deoxynucleotidase [Clostridia bacterium]|nr:5'-deoxynucleotidase [Clostridia bacterium]